MMEWYDHRLNFYDLKKVTSENFLSSGEVDKIWIPFLIFKNTERNEATV